MPQALDSIGNYIPGVFDYIGTGQSVAYTGTAGVTPGPVFTPKGTVVGLLQPADGDTVTLGTVTYTFKTALTPTAGQVLINGSLAAAVLNLQRAINHTGTPGTDYANSGVTAVVNPDVSADPAVANTFVIYSKYAAPTAAQAVTSASAPTKVNVGQAAIGGVGLDSISGPQFVRVMISTAGFVAIGGATVAATVNSFPLAANTPHTFRIAAGQYVSAVQSASGGTLNVIEVA